MNINEAEVLKQVEYYLSDRNLATDKFFRELVQASENGYLGFEFILKCKKVQKLGVTTNEQLAAAVASSTQLELNESKSAIRRINNTPIEVPEQTPEEVAKAAEKAIRDAEKQELSNFYESFQPIIFSTSILAEGVANWRNVTEALLKQHSVPAPYCRFGKTEGNFALNKEKTSQDVIDRLVSDGLTFGESKVDIHVATEEELKKFWELHGRHYNGIMEVKKKEINKDLKASKQKKEKKAKNEFLFAGEKYTDIVNIKNLFKGILGRTANGQKIIAPYHDLLKELLANHDKGEQKLESLSHFTVDVHPEYKDTRCFFAVKNDNSKEDFSAVKCLANFEAKIAH